MTEIDFGAYTRAEHAALVARCEAAEAERDELRTRVAELEEVAMWACNYADEKIAEGRSRGDEVTMDIVFRDSVSRRWPGSSRATGGKDGGA